MNKEILFFLAIVIFTTNPILSAMGESHGFLSAEESTERLERFIRNIEYIEAQVGYSFTEREMSHVLHLANGDVEKAIQIFKDPNYPEAYFDKSEYGKDCSVYYFWNYLIDDCNFRLNSIYFIIPILVIIIVISVIFFYSRKSKTK